MFGVTAKGTEVSIGIYPDCEPNEGGWWCTITPYTEGEINEDYIDDFCIHPYDCDCENFGAVELYAQGYVAEITEY